MSVIKSWGYSPGELLYLLLGGVIFMQIPIVIFWKYINNKPTDELVFSGYLISFLVMLGLIFIVIIVVEILSYIKGEKGLKKQDSEKDYIQYWLKEHPEELHELAKKWITMKKIQIFRIGKEINDFNERYGDIDKIKEKKSFGLYKEETSWIYEAEDFHVLWKKAFPRNQQVSMGNETTMEQI
jgi:hypothetical protein